MDEKTQEEEDCQNKKAQFKQLVEEQRSKIEEIEEREAADAIIVLSDSEDEEESDLYHPSTLKF